MKRNVSILLHGRESHIIDSDSIFAFGRSRANSSRGGYEGCVLIINYSFYILNQIYYQLSS